MFKHKTQNIVFSVCHCLLPDCIGLFILNQNVFFSTVQKFYDSIKNIDSSANKKSKVFSQNQEDGVLLALLEFLKITKPGFYVEFGTQNADQCNTRNLRENHNWKGNKSHIIIPHF